MRRHQTRGGKSGLQNWGSGGRREGCLIPSRVYFRISLMEGQMLSTKIKGGSGLSTNYVITSTKNSKGGQTESKGGQKPPLAPP